MSTIYDPPDIIVSADDLQQDAFDYLETNVDGWTPAEGNLDVIIVETNARMAEEVAQLAVNVPDALIRYLGALMGIVPQPGTSASVQLRVTAMDASGYVVPAGTQFALSDASGASYVFATQLDVVLSAPATTVDLTAFAVDAGAAQNGITPAIGNVVLLDPLFWVSGVTQLATSSGGSDPEDDAAYFDRLSAQLELMAPRPILPGDFAAMARTIAGVDRVLALDLYQPKAGAHVFGPPAGSAGGASVPPLGGAEQTNVERCTTCVCAHADGTGCTDAELAAVRDLLEREREVNFLAYAMPPGSQPVAIAVTAVAAAGFVASDVQAALVAALDARFGPAQFGQPSGGDDPGAWQHQTAIRWSDAVACAQNTPGVDHVVTLTLNGTQADVVLTSATNLPAPTTTATVS